MVNMKNFILDCGKLKICPEIKTMSKPEHIYDFEERMYQMNLKFDERDAYHRNNIRVYPYAGWQHEWNQRIYDSLCEECEELENDEFLMSFRGESKIAKSEWNTKRMCEYMKVIPFRPSVMINISPDWDGLDTKTGQEVEKRTDHCKIQILSNIVERYLAEGSRYTKASYVIENGSEGDHIHAHIVAEMNPMIRKSVNTHLAKGNHSIQLVKQANKMKGMRGMLKGVGIQKIFLRNKKLVDDKLDYLIEAKKPEGHKNKSVVFEKRDLVF